jgi:hypothetical protein
MKKAVKNWQVTFHSCESCKAPGDSITIKVNSEK